MSTTSNTDPTAEGPQATGSGSRTPVVLNRTCQGCRNRKTRCITVPQGPSSEPAKCVRCSKLALECVFLPPAIKRRRKRNETRIKELERKLQEIQEAVTRPGDESASQHSRSERLPSSTAYSTPSDTSAPTDSRDSPGVQAAQVPSSSEPISAELTQVLYWTFCNELAGFYPLVLPELTWNDARAKRPILFKAILTAGSSSRDPKMFKTLFEETGKLVTEQVVMEGNKSLELIQSLLLLSTWYHPPAKFQELKFSQYANMAATMVLDLKSSGEEQYHIPLGELLYAPSDQQRETCRTFLACYFLCSSMALSLRRPTALRHGSWVDDCIKALESGPNVPLNDRRLVEWTKLQRIAEESVSVIGLEDGSIVDFSDARTRFVLKCGVEQTTRWMSKVPQEVLHGPMVMHYHMVLISLHEPALYDGHDLSDFRPPYKLRPLPLVKNSYNEVSIEVATALTQCIASAQQIIHTFLSLSTESLRCVPIIVYTRITYAAVVLIKFDVSARMPESAAHLLDDKELNPKNLLFLLFDKLGPVVGWERFHVPAMFRGILSRVVKWYIEQFDQFSLPDQDDVIKPLLQLSVDDTEREPSVGNTGSDLSQFLTVTPDSNGFYEPGLPLAGPEGFSGWEVPNLGDDAWLGANGEPAVNFVDNGISFPPPWQGP